MKNELDNAIKLVLTEKKKQMYEQRYYDLSLELEIANEVDDERSRINVTKNMVKHKKALDFLDKRIEELAKEVEDFISE